MKSNSSEKEGWQSQKSSLTRDRIVIATLECIVEHGYEKTTLYRIADIAKVSQGSMQYHFGSKIETIKAAITYLNEKRLADRRRDHDQFPEDKEPLEEGIRSYWKHLNEGHFIAYQELVIAARTHPELESVLRPAYQQFLKSWRDDSISQVPAWGEDRENFELVSDIGQYLMEGLAYGRLNGQIGDEQTEKVLASATELLVQMLGSRDPDKK